MRTGANTQRSVTPHRPLQARVRERGKEGKRRRVKREGTRGQAKRIRHASSTPKDKKTPMQIIFKPDVTTGVAAAQL